MVCKDMDLFVFDNEDNIEKERKAGSEQTTVALKRERDAILGVEGREYHNI